MFIGVLHTIWTFKVYHFKRFTQVNHMQAIIASCCGCFYGRTLAVISMSCESCNNGATRGFGLLLPGHIKVDFSDANALEKIFKGSDSTKIYD